MSPRPNPLPETPWTLLHSVQGASPQAWQQLVSLYTPVLSRWCRREGLQSADADNIVQEVFLTVARHLASFRRDRGSGRFRAWLSTITRTRIVDHRRGERRRPTAFGADTLHQVEAPPSADGAAIDPTFRILELRRALDLVRADVQPRTWEAFERTVLQGQVDAEVADELGVTVGAVRLARFRLLRRLRELLA